MGYALEVQNLSKNFGNINAINNISFNINSGEIVGILGPNGSGKTTLMKIITGLVNNYEGKVLVYGNKIGINTKKTTAYLPDSNFIPPS